MKWLAFALALATLTSVGLKCDNVAPAEPSAVEALPGHAYQRQTVAYRMTTTHPRGLEVRFVVDWGDGEVDTSSRTYSTDPDEPEVAAMVHQWPDVGTYSVRALAFLDKQPEKVSDWTEPHAIDVRANAYPAAPEIDAPGYAPRGVGVEFRARATDPDNDSVAIRWSFGDWSDPVPGGAWVTDTARFLIAESAQVWCIARDGKGSESDTTWHAIDVGTAGKVRWFWDDDGEEGGSSPAPPVVFWYNGEEQLWLVAGSGLVRIDPATGRRRRVVTHPGGASQAFSGPPAWCAHAEHIIVGDDGGALCAVHPDRGIDWWWPDLPPESLSYICWGAPGFYNHGRELYVPRDNDSLYYLVDRGDSVEFAAVFSIPCIGAACVVDFDGSVYAHDDSGYVWKLEYDLSVLIWRSLTPSGHVAVYPLAETDNSHLLAGTSDGAVHRLGDDGRVRWSSTVSGEAYSIVSDSATAYVATGSGMVYALDVETGEVKWSSAVTDGELFGSPILAANRLMYVQDDRDVVYCLGMDDGRLVWSCDCRAYGPGSAGGGRGGDMEVPPPSMAILSSGDVIVVGERAVYCVSGYGEGPLDSSAPWPKWQHDAHNSGYADW